MSTLFQGILSVVGGAIGAIIAINISPRHETAAVLRSERLEIVDNKGQSRAVLGTDHGGSTRLLILNQEGKEAIRLGVSSDGKIMNLAFIDRGNILLSATAQPTRGTTITLGDQHQSRVIFGAEPNDVDNDAESADWGLKIRDARSAVPVVSINVHSDLVKGTSDGGIFITHPSGQMSLFPPRR